jgi:hypothetical protein
LFVRQTFAYNFYTDNFLSLTLSLSLSHTHTHSLSLSLSFLARPLAAAVTAYLRSPTQLSEIKKEKEREVWQQAKKVPSLIIACAHSLALSLLGDLDSGKPNTALM